MITDFLTEEEGLDENIYIFSIAEEDEDYILEEDKQVNKPHDKTFRTVLQNKKAACWFINKELKLKGEQALEEGDIELYSTNYITSKYKEIQADVVYKIVNEKIIDGPMFVLIEHQTVVDRKMVNRMEKYAKEIKRSVKAESKLNGTKEATVVKILLYNGIEKWNASLSTNENRARLHGKLYDENVIIMYDNNRAAEKDLENQESLMPIILQLEKPTTNLQEILKNLKKIDINKLDEEEKEILFDYINNIILNKLDKKSQKWVINRFKEKEGENMSVLAQNLNKWYAESIAEGEERGKKQIAKKMVSMKMDIKVISKATGLKIKDIEKLK